MSNKPPRIAFIIDQLRIGGTEKQLIRLANLLITKNIIPYVFTLREYENGLQNSLECNYHNLDIIRIKSLGFIQKIVELVKLLKKYKFDILQTFFQESAIIGALAGRFAQIPCIITSRRDLGTWHNLTNKVNIRISNMFVHRVLANSLAVKNYVRGIEKFRPNKIDVIYNAIDCSKYNDVAKNRNFNDGVNHVTVGIISNFRRKVKRFDLFIDAMNILLLKHKKISVLVVGEVLPFMKNRIPDELRNKYVFTGVVDNVKDYLQKMDIGIICSDSEGFSNVILEYMASGVPCVCTKSGGNVEIINDGVDGFLFIPGDPLSLANKISLLIDNPELRQSFSLKANQKINNEFSWNRKIYQYLDYYQELTKMYKRYP